MLYFVGVGPGDPELITLKAAHILSGADAIALPDSGSDSVVWKIAGRWMAGKPLFRLSMPMKGDRSDWAAAHRQAADTLLGWLEQYQTIAYPVLGDPSIYASSSYLMALLSQKHPCCVVPGVPAMCAAAAALGIPLCEKGEPLTVIDHLDGEALPDGNLVFMKSGGSLDRLQALCGDRPAYVACNLGMDGQWLGRLSDMPSELHSYFTTAIIK